MALAVKRTAAAGGSDPQETTASGFWAQFTGALVAAGWTEIFDFGAISTAWATSTSYAVGDVVIANSNRYVCTQAGTSLGSGTGPSGAGAPAGYPVANGGNLWIYQSLSSTTDDKVYSSTGESGNEKLFLRVLRTNGSYLGTVLAPGQDQVIVFLYQYFDTSKRRGYNQLTHGATGYSFVTGNAHDYAIVASLDGYCAFIRNTVTTNIINYNGGNVRRHPHINATFFTSNNSVTAGPNKTFTFSSGNPVSSGYKVGDPVTIVSQQGTDVYPGVIPVYAALVTEVTSNSITIDYAQEATSAGAFVGQDPMPYFRILRLTNDAAVNAAGTKFAHAWTRYSDGSGPTCLYTAEAAGTDNGVAADPTGRNIVRGGSIGLAVDPNRRSDRVFMTEFCTGPIGEIRGSIPHFYLNPRTTDALWSIGRSNKEATNYDYVTFLFGTVRNCTGPIAISGSASYTVQIVPVDTDNYVEGVVVPPEAGPTSDRAVQVVGNDPVWPHRANPGPDDPASSSTSAGGAGRNSGFNGGFN